MYKKASGYEMIKKGKDLMKSGTDYFNIKSRNDNIVVADA